MQPQIIQNIMAFMERVNLTGKEVPAFNECMAALQQAFLAEHTKPPQQPGT
jgi:hypothetical protein